MPHIAPTSVSKAAKRNVNKPAPIFASLPPTERPPILNSSNRNRTRLTILSQRRSAKPTPAMIRPIAINTYAWAFEPFAAVGGEPGFIQVHDHGVAAVAVSAKAVEVREIETALPISRIVKLIARDAGIATGIEMGDEAIYEIEKVILRYVVVAAVEPVDHIAAYLVVMILFCFAAYACVVEPVDGEECIEAVPKLRRERSGNEVFCYAYLVSDEAVYEGYQMPELSGGEGRVINRWSQRPFPRSKERGYWWETPLKRGWRWLGDGKDVCAAT
ncbi:unnamed protein product [Sphagnum jensenii]|uniref:Uncharacterized protein n=1 Tax=Sphagnum jensenii TaxID=128206 RepID=A0ABP0VMH3_9BRYO